MKPLLSVIVGAITISTAVLANAGGATEQFESCPKVGTIEERSDERIGFIYTAPAQNGLFWRGEHPMADAGDVQKFRFSQRKDVVRGSNSPVCEYVVPGKPGAGTRMTLHELLPI